MMCPLAAPLASCVVLLASVSRFFRLSLSSLSRLLAVRFRRLALLRPPVARVDERGAISCLLALSLVILLCGCARACSMSSMS